MEIQAWQIRRCLSFINNRIANRPHKPRCQILVKLMAHIGIVWPEREKDTAEEDEMEEAEEEGCETEDEGVDEVVEPLHNEPATLNVEPLHAANTERAGTKDLATAPVLATPVECAELAQLPSPASVVTPPPRAKPMLAMTPEDVSWLE